MKKLPNNEKVAQNGKFTQSIRRSPPNGPKCKFVQNKKTSVPKKIRYFKVLKKSFKAARLVINIR